MKKNFDKARLFVDKILEDETSRDKNVATLLSYSRHATAHDCMDNVYASILTGLGAVSLIYSANVNHFVGYGLSLIGAVVAVASVSVVIYDKFFSKADSTVFMTNENKKPNEKLFLDSEDATQYFIGNLTNIELCELVKYAQKKYPAYFNKKNNKIRMENLWTDNLKNWTLKTCSTLKNSTLALIPNTTNNIQKKYDKKLKQEQLEIQKKERLAREKILEEKYEIN